MDAAKTLGLSSRTVTRWCESGKLPAVAKTYGATVTYQISLQAVEFLKIQEQQQEAEQKLEKVQQENHADFLKLWKHAMANGLLTGKPFSKNTIDLYHSNAKRFLELYGKLTEKTLELAMAGISAHQFAKKRRLYEAVICFSKFLIKQGALEPSFLDAVRELKPKRHLPPKRLTVGEDGIQALLNACDSVQDRLIIILLASTGVRASEACAIQMRDIDLDKGILTIPLGKGGKRRQVGLSQSVIDVIQMHIAGKAIQEEDFILLNMLGQPMDRHGLRQRVERIGKDANVKASPHALRRAFVTINANKGRPLQMLQKACGHADITTTMSYCLTAEQEVIEAMKGWE